MRIFDVDAIGPDEGRAASDQLLAEEVVHAAFRAATTTILFTSRRIVTVQLHTLLTERLETSSYSYRAMRQFSILEGAHGESRSEIKIWIGNDAQPLHLRANSGTHLGELQRLLTGMLR